MLKGKFDKFAALTTNSQLYLWGEGTVKILPKNINIPDNLINNRLYFPFKVPFLEDIKIIDYCIEDKFIGLITVPSSSNLLMEE